MPTELPSPCPSGPVVTSMPDRKSTRLNSSHSQISYAVFCLKKKKHNMIEARFVHGTNKRSKTSTKTSLQVTMILSAVCPETLYGCTPLWDDASRCVSTHCN